MRVGHYTPHIFFRAQMVSRLSSESRKSLLEPIKFNLQFMKYNGWTDWGSFPLPLPLPCLHLPIFPYFSLPFPSHIYHTPYFPLFLFIFPSSFCPFISHSPFPSTFLCSNTIYAIFLYCQFPFSFSFPSLVPFKCTLVSLLTLCIIKKCDYLNVKVQASL